MRNWFQEMYVKCNSVSYLQKQEGQVRMQAARDTGGCEKELAYKMHWEKWTEANIGTVSQLESWLHTIDPHLETRNEGIKKAV